MFYFTTLMNNTSKNRKNFIFVTKLKVLLSNFFLANLIHSFQLKVNNHIFKACLYKTLNSQSFAPKERSLIRFPSKKIS